jgi:hypothetical protein
LAVKGVDGEGTVVSSQEDAKKLDKINIMFHDGILGVVPIGS